jgi:hypothetical protein
MNSQVLKMELIHSLPSNRIFEVTSNLAVENPKTNELIFLKQRPTYENVPLSDYIKYNEIHDKDYDYKELIAKFVIIDHSLLGRRGKIALGIA